MDGKYSGVQPHRTLENLLLREIMLFFLLSSISVYLLFYIHNLVVFFCSKAFRTIADVNLKYIAVFFCLLLLISLSFPFLSILLVVLLLLESRAHHHIDNRVLTCSFTSVLRTISWTLVVNGALSALMIRNPHNC